MRVAVVGAGRVGGGLAATWVRAGHDVTLSGSRDPSALERKAADIGTRSVAVPEAAAGADAVVLAVPASIAKQSVCDAGDLSGKVLIDCTNDVGAVPGSPPLAVQLAEVAAGAHVVKAFNTVFAALYDDIAAAPGRPDLLFCGDDDAAKELAATLISDAGYEPIDAGGLDAAGELEDFARVVIRLCYGRGLGPFVYRLRHPREIAAE